MSGTDTASLAVFALVATLVSVVAWRHTRATTVDFFLAGRRTGMITNAGAICGDYLSAASFLGVAGAVYASGLDGIWYATGFAAGFVPVLLFVAAPLRRLGTVSLPDFLAVRFDSAQVRVAAVVSVELVILSYLVPQAVGSGLTWELLVGQGIAGLSPYATGIVVSTVAVGGIVVIGGMRGTTWNQALQFGFLLAVVVWLSALLWAGGFSYPAAVEQASAEPLQAVVGDRLVGVTNQLSGESARFGAPGARYGPIGQAALLVTLVLGTAGLPHVMNRYFTAVTGRAARATTVWVLGLAGSFYALAVLLGTAARVMVAGRAEEPWLAELTVDGVLRVPEHALLVLGRLLAGTPGLAVVSAAAFAAMVSTIGGLLLAAAASFGHDVVARIWRPSASPRVAVVAGRGAVLVVSVLAAVVAISVEPERLVATFPSVIATMVTWAFALAGSALTPAVLLGIWWRDATARGAVAGIWTGAIIAVGALVVGLVIGPDPSDGLSAVLLAPAMIAAPISAVTIVVVSRLDTGPSVRPRVWTRMHGTAADRQTERMAQITLRGRR
ncbi:MAG: cation acetate symporter [Nitriliruptor sp.]|nr:MAG: cation acetate symporter [Nitriliruptor sp.]